MCVGELFVYVGYLVGGIVGVGNVCVEVWVFGGCC